MNTFNLLVFVMISFCLSIVSATTSKCEVDSCDLGYCCNDGECVKFDIDEPLCKVSNGCDVLKGDCLTDDNLKHLQSKGLFLIEKEDISYEEDEDDEEGVPIYSTNKSKYELSEEDDCESENEQSEEDDIKFENKQTDEDDCESENDQEDEDKQIDENENEQIDEDEDEDIQIDEDEDKQINEDEDIQIDENEDKQIDEDDDEDDCESENDDSEFENDDNQYENEQSNEDDGEFEDEESIEIENEDEDEQLAENEQSTEIDNEEETENEQPTEIEDEQDDRLKVSEDGRCGKDFGICKQGYCCSEFGWCGNTEKYCKKGCQFGFGICEDEDEDEEVSMEISDDETDDQVTVTDVSQDGRCGKEFGSCKEGYCCSKWGWCGKTELHCSVKSGCQSEFGLCAKKDGFVEEQKMDGRCGVGIGSCPEGYCCSKWGWCGKSDSHCSIEEGCQSEFGACKPIKNTHVDPDGRCGKGIGSCAKGYCCNKWGWCGKSDNHCNVEAGCQSEFSDACKGIINIGINQRCGEGYGQCPKGQCCSKYGWCGKGKSYCSNGCQSEFGICQQESQNNSYGDSSIWRCGENFGSCSKGYCCSKWGWCGKSKSYCDKNLGCQSEFGHCW